MLDQSEDELDVLGMTMVSFCFEVGLKVLGQVVFFRVNVEYFEERFFFELRFGFKLDKNVFHQQSNYNK